MRNTGINLPCTKICAGDNLKKRLDKKDAIKSYVDIFFNFSILIADTITFEPGIIRKKNETAQSFFLLVIITKTVK